jgi:hypothetical protein
VPPPPPSPYKQCATPTRRRCGTPWQET